MPASSSRASQGGGPSVADMLAPYADEIATHEFEKLEPIGRVVLRPRTVNWKNVGDNYSDALHIPVAHPGLTRLFGATYRVESKEWVDRMSGDITDKPSTQLAGAHVPEVPAGLGEPRARQATLLGVLQDVAELRFRRLPRPGGHHAMAAGLAHRLPDPRNRLCAARTPAARCSVARYCNWRINRQVNAEDTVLIQRVQDGMASGSYRVGPLAAGEVALRSFGARLRQLIPESLQPAPPVPGWSRRVRGLK